MSINNLLLPTNPPTWTNTNVNSLKVATTATINTATIYNATVTNELAVYQGADILGGVAIGTPGTTSQLNVYENTTIGTIGDPNNLQLNGNLSIGDNTTNYNLTLNGNIFPPLVFRQDVLTGIVSSSNAVDVTPGTISVIATRIGNVCTLQFCNNNTFAGGTPENFPYFYFTSQTLGQPFLPLVYQPFPIGSANIVKMNCIIFDQASAVGESDQYGCCYIGVSPYIINSGGPFVTQIQDGNLYFSPLLSEDYDNDNNFIVGGGIIGTRTNEYITLQYLIN